MNEPKGVNSQYGKSGGNNRYSGKIVSFAPKFSAQAPVEESYIPVANLTSIYIRPTSSYLIFWRIIGRIIQFIWFGMVLVLGSIKDHIFSWFSYSHRLSRLQKGAKRLKKVLLTLGGAMIKAGQQLSLRLDLLPGIYCDELSTLQDKAPYFSQEVAIKIVELELNRPIDQIFSEGKLEPLGSGSVACVYKACLPDGQMVAVKIRRPKVLESFSADLKVMDLLFNLLEFLTVLRSGISRNLRSELRNILMDELDFRLEGRYQELARRYFRKRKNLKVSVAKVYHDYSTGKMITSTYVTGLWMNDILHAIEKQDHVFLKKLKKFNIAPKKLAKQLIRLCHYSFFECPFFHADPHPGNILVKPDNNLVLIDFGACGVFNVSQRNLMEQMYLAYQNEDIGRMVEAVIGLLGPLPPIDVDSLVKDMEKDWWYGYYGIKSKHSAWWERTSMRLWISMLNLMRKYKIPVPAHVLHMIRATLLYDTLAARLYARINVFKEYRKYLHGAAKKISNDSLEENIRTLIFGHGDVDIVRIRRLRDLASTAFFKAQSFLNNEPFYRYADLTGKIYDFIGILFRFLYLCTISAIVAMGIYFIFNGGNLRGAVESLFLVDEYIKSLLTSGTFDQVPLYGVNIALSWLVFSLFVLFLNLRQIHFRFQDKDRN